MQESMQEADSIHDLATTDQDTRPPSGRRRGIVGLLLLFLALLLLTVLPPLINVSRFQLRIARNIGAALGRPVHFDQVSLMLFPLPGFTLKTFVIDEDPAFGYEPILRADEVQVTLRISSLWRPHTEFSKIAFTEPSVNLVHLSNGKWNIEGLLLQASHIQAAPTGQRFAGAARRFPYIEATGARLNLKLDQEKTPFSLTDADFSLWLPEPHQWRLRLEAHPTRTDTGPGDTGTIRVDGTLGGADLDAASLAQIPIDLHGDWRDAQLGGLSRLLFGDDRGLRGDFSGTFNLLGTVGRNSVATRVKIANARRADFVPDETLSLDAACNAIAGGTFHSFTSIDCHWPTDSSDPPILTLAANLPDVLHPRFAVATVTLPGLPADTFFDWLSVATPHPPAVLAGAGTLYGTLTWGPPHANSAATYAARPDHLQPQPAPAEPTLAGEIRFSGGSIATDPANNRSIPLGNVLLSSTPAPAAPPPHSRAGRSAPPPAPGPDSFDLLPVSLDLGGKQPAILEGHFDAAGYTLHLTGTVLYANLIDMAKAVPQFGDGLQPVLDRIANPTPGPATKPAAADRPASPTQAAAAAPAAPIHVDLTATRVWGGPQAWRESAPPPARRTRR